MARLYSANISSASGRPYRVMALPRPMARPVVAIPPLRPEAPQPTVCESSTTTRAPCWAASRAADRPVKPAPTTAMSARSGTGVRR